MNLQPRAVSCPRCRRRVLEAVWDVQDDCLIGRPLLDPVRLDRQQLLACVLTGVVLWQVMPYGPSSGWCTCRRTPWWPSMPVGGVTVPVHRCGSRWLGPPVRLAPTSLPVPDRCPF